MNNKELIERLRLLIKNGRYYTKEQARIDISDAVNALQDAEAEINRLKADARKQAAIHLNEYRIRRNILHQEAKLLEEINRLKADARKQAAIHLHEEAKLLEEINRLKAWNEAIKTNLLATIEEADLFQAKLYEQVDPIELVIWLFEQYNPMIKPLPERAKAILEQFKKERNEKEQ